MNYPVTIFLLGVLIGLLQFRSPGDATPARRDLSWPKTYEGVPIERLPLSEKETAFARGFPGAIATFSSPGGRQVILRRVDRATRKLHDSATCLRASGHQIGTESTAGGWRCYTASHDAQLWQVRERIEDENGDRTWVEVSAWYWHALLRPGSAPWLSVTVLQPL